MREVRGGGRQKEREWERSGVEKKEGEETDRQAEKDKGRG